MAVPENSEESKKFLKTYSFCCHIILIKRLFFSFSSASVKVLSFFIILDRDECKTESHGCQQKCVNEYGSYSCACLNGYKLNSDKKNCSGKVFKDSQWICHGITFLCPEAVE